jgi:SAM-dependent methyltransferase
MNETQNVAKRISELTQEQGWIYKFVLPDGQITPGPANKGQKNVVKTKVIQAMNLKEKRVLDVGCAEGMFSFYMAAEGASVTGIEVNKKRIKKAEFIKKALGMKNVEFIPFDAEAPNSWGKLSDNFDVGFCFSVLHRVSDPFNLIAQLASKCETLVFEWKAPEGFLTNHVSLAFHEVEGELDPRNIKSRQALLSEENIMDSGKEKPYWCPSVGAIKEISSSFGFTHFQVIRVSKYSFIRVAYAYIDLILKILLKGSEPIAWRRYQRVMIICSKTQKEQIKLLPEIIRHRWDGTES